MVIELLGDCSFLTSSGICAFTQFPENESKAKMSYSDTGKYHLCVDATHLRKVC